jgi:hypothetical protein
MAQIETRPALAHIEKARSDAARRLEEGSVTPQEYVELSQREVREQFDNSPRPIRPDETGD